MSKLNKEEAVQWYAQNRGLYKKLSTKISNILFELLEEEGITVHAINNRTKDVDSFKNKITGPKYDDPINQITDLSGIRIIAYVEDDLKPICKVIEETFHIDPDNSLDKSNELGTDKVGYRSIHYIGRIKEERLGLTEYKKFKELRFEIQVRTILQHAWAEIEHDKNYKFNGVLPDEIKRRFKILAGTLELADREFNQLSKEIDSISKSVSVAEKENSLNKIPLNSTTLKQFLINRFQKLITSNIVKPNLLKDEIIIEELKEFGIKDLNDLDSIIPPDFEENYSKEFPPTGNYGFIGLLRDLMIIKDYDKYFKKVWKHSWNGLDKESVEFYNYYDVDIKSLIEKYELTLFN